MDFQRSAYPPTSGKNGPYRQVLRGELGGTILPSCLPIYLPKKTWGSRPGHLPHPGRHTCTQPSGSHQPPPVIYKRYCGTGTAVPVAKRPNAKRPYRRRRLRLSYLPPLHCTVRGGARAEPTAVFKSGTAVPRWPPRGCRIGLR